jgi:membrane fusion protein (multidrug efflux system)
VGNLVGSGQATLLATIVREDPIYAYFTASERELLEYRELFASGEQNVAYMAVATDTGFPHIGKVDYASNRVDPSTGTIEARAVFPNTDGVILPGLFARIRLPSIRGRALLVPDTAVGADQGGKYVFVVGEDNTVEQRRVTVGALTEDKGRVIESGVTKDDWVIVNGLQRTHPGSRVSPKRTDTALADPTPADGQPPRQP